MKKIAVARFALLPLALFLLAAANEPAAPASGAPGEQEVYVVKPGETLAGIANREKVPRVLIAEANGLTAPYAIRAGQRLFIPRTRHHTVASGDTRFTISYLYAVPWGEIAVANGIEPDSALRPGQKLLIPTVVGSRAAPAPAATAGSTPTAPPARFAWPVQATVRRGFTPRGRANYHDGIDMALPIGTAVRASAAGKVLFAGDEPRQFGKLVVVDHGQGWHTAYAFLSRITVKVGDDVSAGERVGLSGRTGMARGPELHFEVRRDNAPVDPQAHLPRR